MLSFFVFNRDPHTFFCLTSVLPDYEVTNKSISQTCMLASIHTYVRMYMHTYIHISTFIWLTNAVFTWQKVSDYMIQSEEHLLKRTSDEVSRALQLISDALTISTHSDNLMEMKAEALLMVFVSAIFYPLLHVIAYQW